MGRKCYKKKNEEITKRIIKPEGKRKKGRPSMRWVDGVNLGAVNWKTKAQERDGGRKFLE
jgi:hypothetical protein